MKIQDVMKVLAKKGISTSIHYNSKEDQCYVDLQTMAKSELHLYESGLLCGRYLYEKQMDLNQDAEALVTELCYEFNKSLHGKSFGNEAWVELCRAKNIVIETYSM